MTPDEYKRLAYEATVFAAARRALQEKYLNGGGSQKESLICELLPFDERVVPNDAISDGMQRLQLAEQHALDEMKQYALRKLNERPIPEAPQPQPQPQVRAPAQAAAVKPGGKARRT